MKGVRFYQEFSDGRRTLPEGNVVAVLLDAFGRPLWHPDGCMVDAIAAVYERPNSPVATTAASRDYLRWRCKRVPEARARAIHPTLFQVLDRT